LSGLLGINIVKSTTHCISISWSSLTAQCG
jgi:hypothetical protein